MGSVTHSITDFFCGDQSIADTLLPIPTPCLPNGGNRKVAIKIFDKKHLLPGVISSPAVVKQTLEPFYNSLHATAGLPPAVAQNLQNFSFEVTYIPRDSTADERKAFGMLDFPFYLETTDGSNAFTKSDGKHLLEAHGIQKLAKVRTVVSEHEIQDVNVRPYPDLEGLIDDDTVLGSGYPGTYFNQNDQTRCRKVGVIKINLILKNPVVTTRQPKFFGVLKHELGHMFGMDHEPGTLMDKQYKNVAEHQEYTVNQITVISQVLTILTQP
jgi:hypothetical protein